MTKMELNYKEIWKIKDGTQKQMQEQESLLLESAIFSTLMIGLLDFMLNTDGWSLLHIDIAVFKGERN